MARGGAAGKEKGEKIIAQAKEDIAAKETQRNVYFGVAVGALLVGLGLALAPLSRKPRKQKAPAADFQASGGREPPEPAHTETTTPHSGGSRPPLAPPR